MYFVKKKDAELQRVKKEAAITKVILGAMASSESIWNAKQIQIEANKLTNVKISIKTVLWVLKKKFKMSYRRIKRVAHAGNSEQNKVLRFLYSLKMIQLYRDQ
jgi:hypothetical protein